MGDAQQDISFRALRESDLALLAEWLRRPHVVEWWGGDDAAPSLEAVRRKYLPRLDEDASVSCYLAYEGDEAIGFAQSYVAAGFKDVGRIDTPDGTALLMVAERPWRLNPANEPRGAG